MNTQSKKETSKKPFPVGSSVEWIWMGRKVRGEIKRIYLKPVMMILGGTPFKRNGSSRKPAYLVESQAGRRVIKLHTELTKKK